AQASFSAAQPPPSDTPPPPPVARTRRRGIDWSSSTVPVHPAAAFPPRNVGRSTLRCDHHPPRNQARIVPSAVQSWRRSVGRSWGLLYPKHFKFRSAHVNAIA